MDNEYSIENLKYRFLKHAMDYEAQLKNQPECDIPDPKFSLPKALYVICLEIEKLNQNI